MEVQDYQILDQYSNEQVWCPSQLLALMPHLCVLSTQPHSLHCLDGNIHLLALTGITPDISIILLFTFYQPVFYAMYDRILSTNPGAEPPRDARDSGSARSHSTHLETSSSDRP